MQVRGIDANYYVVTDADALSKFYAAFLGAPAMSIPGRFYEWNFADDTSFGLYGSPEGDVKGKSGSVMFAVDDVAGAVAECKALGVHFHDDEVTDTPVCQMAFGEDPEGNQFILHKRKAG